MVALISVQDYMSICGLPVVSIGALMEMDLQEYLIPVRIIFTPLVFFHVNKNVGIGMVVISLDMPRPRLVRGTRTHIAFCS